MQWSDDGLVLGARRHGESGVILELLTRQHGRHLGLVHGGGSRKLRPVLQAGNSVRAVWRARLDEQLGSFAVEASEERSGRLIESALALAGLAAAAALLRLLPERDPHPALFEAAEELVDQLSIRPIAPALFVRFELIVLSEFGFGLDLATCAATGASDNLLYVSPRTGRAVSGSAGEPYKDRLLPLPPFLRAGWNGPVPSPEEIEAGFALTELFLRGHVFGPRGLPLPEERARFVALSRRPNP